MYTFKFSPTDQMNILLFVQCKQCVNRRRAAGGGGVVNRLVLPMSTALSFIKMLNLWSEARCS